MLVPFAVAHVCWYVCSSAVSDAWFVAYVGWLICSSPTPSFVFHWSLKAPATTAAVAYHMEVVPSTTSALIQYQLQCNNESERDVHVRFFTSGIDVIPGYASQLHMRFFGLVRECPGGHFSHNLLQLVRVFPQIVWACTPIGFTVNEQMVYICVDHDALRALSVAWAMRPMQRLVNSFWRSGVIQQHPPL